MPERNSDESMQSCATRIAQSPQRHVIMDSPPLPSLHENVCTFSSLHCITQIGNLLRAKSASAADFVSATKFISPPRSGRAVMRFSSKNSPRHARRAMLSGRPDSAKSARIYIQPDKIIAAVQQARASSKRMRRHARRARTSVRSLR